MPSHTESEKRKNQAKTTKERERVASALRRKKRSLLGK